MDRLIKELRLAGIATLEQANAFLGAYLPQYNRRFALRPAQAHDLHRPLPAGTNLVRLLCIKTKRVLRRDWTVAHQGQLYQIQDTVRATHVMVEDRLDGTRRLTHQGRPLTYHAIPARPMKAAKPEKLSRPRPRVRPMAGHPWNTYGRFVSRRAATT